LDERGPAAPRPRLLRLRAEIASVLVGKADMVESLLIGLIAPGHVLIEGVPGLAKTLAAHSLALASGLSYSRVQFTADLLPADITGTLMFRQNEGAFVTRRGPIFAQVVVADEINRAPAKVQSALLEAMEEGRVTIGTESHSLPNPFFVVATQNPIEHEGTYALPEAELDRFLIKIKVSYPDEKEEREIVRGSDARLSLGAGRAPGTAIGSAAQGSAALGGTSLGGANLFSSPASASSAVRAVLGPEDILAARKAVSRVAVADEIVSYATGVVRATRPEFAAQAKDPRVRECSDWLDYGASPRASIALFRCARARALLAGRSHVLPEDVKLSAPDVLRHRLVLSYVAQSDGVKVEDVIDRVLSCVELP
jgi:MoxR-like ATPase